MVRIYRWRPIGSNLTPCSRSWPRRRPGLALAPPVDYGHLTWGLPRGLSIDITPALLTRYVANYARALVARYQAEALYVVDVHGSPVHRLAIQEGLAASGVERWKFRWLHQPLVEFASERGDQHAGGVETAVIEAIGPGLLDPRWWPGRINELAAGEMTFELALRDAGRTLRTLSTTPSRIPGTASSAGSTITARSHGPSCWSG